MTLTELKINQKAVILKINCIKRARDRLNDIGVFEGDVITLINKAPFNDPLLIKVKNSYIAIRVSLASQIEVLIW